MMEDEGHTRCPECGLILYREVTECPRCLASIGKDAAKAPLVETVYEEEVLDKTPRERKDIKRITLIVSIVIIAVILVVSLSYFFIIPRVQLKVTTVYQEASGLVINFDSKVKNEGTLNIQHYTMNITILNSSSGVVAGGDYYLSDLDARSSHEFESIRFLGDQYEGYHITIKIHFESSGKDYSETFEHRVSEWMYERFDDEFMRWGG